MGAQTAKERLLLALPYLRNSVAEAKQDAGRVQLGILRTNQDGSGKIVAKFEAEEFFADLAEVLGAEAQTEEDDLNAEAVKFLQRNGLMVHT